MRYFFVPVDLKIWNLFDKVNDVGHIEPFNATKSMNLGDIVFLHIGSQVSSIESGIYAVGKIVSKPYIYKNNPNEYCYNKLTVNVKIIKISKDISLINHNECKKYINQFRSHHELKQGKKLYDNIMKKIIYCRVGWMNTYNGLHNGDAIKHGGSYNKNNIGLEIYNFASYNGIYYGYVQPTNDTINIEKNFNEKKNDYANNVLVVFVATSDKYGQVVVGWYNNAKVYKKYQMIPNKVLVKRKLKEINVFNLCSNDATLILPVEKRNMVIKGIGRSNVWYGNDEMNAKVIRYIDDFNANREKEIKKVNQNLISLEGQERETIIKSRVNQGIFRDIMLNKYKHCCLCGITNQNLLIASHIKPWSKSDKNEKLNEYNGLLLCSIHDKLFDLGYISFNDDGTILISNELNNNDRILSNINESNKIEITEDFIPFIRYHRENIFRR